MSEYRLVCLHALGASRREFEPLAKRLRGTAEVVALDLPGFGDASVSAGTSVHAMADSVVRAVADLPPARWLFVGHSMGGKIATIVTGRALAGEAGLFGLAGVVLLAASPPSPEPMDEDRRESMLGWAADGPLAAAAARTFVDANVGSPLPGDLDRLMIDDVRRTTREAWLAWLERGSREDWSGTVGTLDVPALIVAGGADGDLGPDAQRADNGPVYPRAQFRTLDGAGHLLPLERPDEVASAIDGFWRERAGHGPRVPTAFSDALEGERLGNRTRGILAARIVADDTEPQVLDGRQLATLRVIADLVVPQDGAPIDLAARVDAQLAAGGGDGWRFDTLPADAEAYRAGLDALANLVDLDPEEQHERIQAVVDGTVEPSGGWDAQQLSQWFEDARADLVRQWMAHPATMARIGFDGYLTGSSGRAFVGWQRLAAVEREAWEPEPAR